jgi:uncharacterized protein (TIGR02246 family)
VANPSTIANIPVRQIAGRGSRLDPGRHRIPAAIYILNLKEEWRGSMRKNSCSMAVAITAALLLVAGWSLQVVASDTVQATGATATNATDEAAIKEVLASYETALNTSDTDAVMPLYAEDAVLIPQATPTVVGSKAVEQFYIATFAAVQINLKFEIAEVQVVSNEWAFLRTTSTGTMKTLATGMEAPAQTQELFILHKESGQWKLARYSFSSTQPATM